MKSRLVLFFVFCILVSLTGCIASVGPINDHSFEETLRSTGELGSESILQMGRVEWLPSADAYDFNEFKKTRKFQQGVIVLQESRLFILGWQSSEQKYEVLLKIEYSNAKDVRRRVWGASQRIVIELKDGTIHAFSLTSDNGIGVSVARINKAIALLRNKIPSSDAYLEERSQNNTE